MNKWLIYAIIAVSGVGLLWFADVSRDKRAVAPPPQLTDVETQEQVSKETESTEGSIGTGMEYPKIINKYPPAECSVEGSIVYLEPHLYENKNANIIYKNIDSVARHIKWTITPQDDLAVGPNLFASLPIPDGIEDVTVGLPESPKSKNYILTAKVTYGRFEKGNLEIKEADCFGQIPVEINY